MPMHVSPSIDMSSDSTATVFPQMSPIAKSLSPATQSDILEILQREQDHAMALLSSSPLLASLFVSYANQAAALESSTPSTESQEWKALENTISRLQEEVDELKPENLEIKERLAAAAASLEAFRSQVTSLNEVNVGRQHEIDFLRSELSKTKDKHDRLVEDLNVERVTLQSMVSDLEAQKVDLKETLVQQQLKLSKLDQKAKKTIQDAKEKAEWETRERAKLEAERARLEARERADRKAMEDFRREERDKAAQEAREEAGREAKQKAGQTVHFTDAEQGPSPTEVAHPALGPEVVPWSIPSLTPAEEIPTTPKPWPAPSLTPAPAPAKTEPDKPLSLWDRKKRDASGGGRTETITMPTITGTGDRPLKSSGWGSWGSSILNTVAAVELVRTPSPELPPVRPKIEGPPRGFTVVPPSKSENTSEQRVETEGPAEGDDTGIPAEEEEINWGNLAKKMKKRQAASVAQMPSVPNTPDPDDPADSPFGGGRKKKKGGRGLKGQVVQTPSAY